MWRKTWSLMLAIVAASFLLSAIPAFSADTATKVYLTPNGKEFRNQRDIVRTSAGRLYYISGDGGHTSNYDGWINVYTSLDGQSWEKVSGHDQHNTFTSLAAAIDANNVIHILTYDWSGHPYYERFNTADSPKGDNSWEGYEILDSVGTTHVGAYNDGTSSIAIDANGVPHVLYQLSQTVRKTQHNSLTYANRVGGVWNKTVVWAIDAATNFSGKCEAAVGPDNAPYLRMGTKMAKGNANNPTSFDMQELGGGYSFVIHQNGDVRVALAYNGNYANYVHDHTQPWTSGWTIFDSGTPDVNVDNMLVLAEDTPYLITRESDGIGLRKGFDPYILIAAEAPSQYFGSLTSRWSYYNFHMPATIDVGMTSFFSGIGTTYLYTTTSMKTVADFSATPVSGIAPVTVNFSDSSKAITGQSIVYREWDFENDGIVDSTAINPSHTYSKPGRYSVRLTVTDSAGAVDTRVMKDLILADQDSDGDGVPDSRDNCPSVANPWQYDVNGDGIGNACDNSNLLSASAGYIAALNTPATADAAATDVSGSMKDGLLTQTVNLGKTKSGYNVLYLKSDAYPSMMVSAACKLYVNTISTGTSLPVTIYAYSADGVTPLATPVVTASVSAGWNSIDITPLVRAMGTNYFKMRISLANGTIDVSEAYVQVVPISEWVMTVDATSLTFQSVETIATSQRSIKVTNTGAGYLQIGAVTGVNPPFSLSPDSCSGSSVGPGKSCRIDIVFSPSTPGTFTGSLIIPSNDTAHPSAVVTLNGTATAKSAISGVVTEQGTQLPLSNVTAVLHLDTASTGDKSYSWENDGTAAGPDVNFTHVFTASDYVTVGANDGTRVVCPHGQQYNIGCGFQFRVRNPYAFRDQFKVVWNGVGGQYDNDFLAQAFKPSKSGKLTKVSLYVGREASAYAFGTAWVNLRSTLGGDVGTALAQSSSVDVSTVFTTSDGWVDFVFPTPASLTAGQTYYLELQSNAGKSTGGGYYLLAQHWGYQTPNPYAAGNGFTKQYGAWNAQTDRSYAFATYIDGAADQSQQSSASNGLFYGYSDITLYMQIYNWATGNWESAPSLQQNYVGYDDQTMQWSPSASPQSYLDKDGWLNVRMFVGSIFTAGSTTDLFTAQFTDTKSATTDGNGAYAFPGLPDGTYSISFFRPGYQSATASGSLASGSNASVNASLAPLPPAIIQGTVTSDYTRQPLAGVNVTVTDSLSAAHTTVTDAQGGYRVSGIVDGTYTVTSAMPGYQPQTQSGMVSPGQTLTLNSTITPILPVVSGMTTSSATVDSAVITWTTDQPASSLVQFGESTAYGSTVSDQILTTTHVVTLTGLKASSTYHYKITSANGYGIAASTADATFATPAFTAKSLGDNGNVAVMEVTGSYDAKNADGTVNDQARKVIAKEYFKTHADLDFLVILSDFNFSMPEGAAEGFYLTVKNDVQGINQPIFDNSAQFGSAGKLQGTIDLGNVTLLGANAYGSELDRMVTLLNHEMGHRWGAYVRFKNADGTLNTALLGKDSAHWSYLLDTQGSFMYGNGWKDNGDGSFISTAVRSGYSPLDLYLMGMIPKEQVPPMLLIDNPAIDKTQLPKLGATVTGTARTVTIDDIIAAEGARIPDATSSQKKFNVGFVLLIRPGDSIGTAPAAIETLRTAWTGRFSERTSGSGGIDGVPPTLNIIVDSPTDGATITGPNVTVTGVIINSTGAETGITVNGFPATVMGNRFIANHVPLQSGTNSLALTGTDVNGMTATITKSINSASGTYLRIESNVESGVAPLAVSLRLNGSFVISNPNITISGPAAATLQAGAEDNEYSLDMAAEGTYVVTATAIAPDGETYSDTATITVVSRYELANLLQTKWSSINSKLIQSDIAGALVYLRTSSRSYYQGMFTALGSNLPLLAQAAPPLDFVYANDERAKCRVFRQVMTRGQLVTVGYPIYFEKEDGIWRLVKY